MAITKVILLGASGVLGSAILSALQDSGHFKITVLSRPESTATFPDTINLIRAPYTPTTFHHAFINQHAVICATGLSGIPLQQQLIDACLTTGVSRYITNDFGNPEDFQGLPELEFARKPKQDILEYAKHQASTHHGTFTWTALATGHFLDYAIKKFPHVFGFDVPQRHARIVDEGVEPFSSTVLADIALAVVGILTHPEQTANRYLLVRTLETTQNELLAAFERETGTEWSVKHVPSRELLEVGREKMKKGEKGAILDLLPVQIFEKGVGRSTLPMERYDNGLLGLRERSVNEVVRDVLASI